MEFDKSRVYTALNAEELKVGSKVIVADNLEELKLHVSRGDRVRTLRRIEPEHLPYRFVVTDCEYVLAYLVSEPEEDK